MRDARDSMKAKRDVVAEISPEAFRYDFYYAMRLIDAANLDKPKLGTAKRPADEVLRLGQTTEFSFAPTSLTSFAHDTRSGKPRMEVRFFGLFGPNGPLPLHLTGYARERRLHKGDETFSRFADVFHHRLLLLFYRAWAQAQPVVSLDRPAEDRFGAYVGSLIGAGGPEWLNRDAAPDHVRLAYAGVLARQVRNADGLARLLSGYLGINARVEQFVGHWLALQPDERSRIGRRGALRRQTSAQLGQNAVLGKAVFDRQHHFRIHLGPLSLKEFNALLPTGSALPAVQALVKQYVGLEFGWDLKLELQRAEVPPTRLGRHSRLGWATWVGKPKAGKPPALTLVPHSSLA